jgi:hypothetical protein
MVAHLTTKQQSRLKSGPSPDNGKPYLFLGGLLHFEWDSTFVWPLRGSRETEKYINPKKREKDLTERLLKPYDHVQEDHECPLEQLPEGSGYSKETFSKGFIKIHCGTFLQYF